MKIIDYVKHEIVCRCFPTLTNDSKRFYEFVAISGLDENGELVKELISCDNCGIVHRITDICKSEITTFDESVTQSIDELFTQIPEKLGELLKKHDPPRSVILEASMIVLNRLWGKRIILTRQRDNETIVIKEAVINGPEQFTINVQSYEALVSA